METLTLVVTVRCLSCGATYAKPEGRGTVKTNPGCPECGYLGWSLVDPELTPADARRRSAADPPHRRDASGR